MKTVYTTDAAEAAEFIKRGGVVAFPTETVYGLGANVFNATAVAKIFEAKRRPADNPLIAHIAEIGRIEELAREISAFAHIFIDSFFPGPLTIVLPKSNDVPLIATAGLDTIGIRMPRFELAHAFLTACGMPVAAPSANISGRPSPTTWEAVAEDLDGRIDCILQGDGTEIGLESTVVDCTGVVPLLLRSGAVSLAQLQAIVPKTSQYIPTEKEQPRSPGMRHRHYSPQAKVVLFTDKLRPANKELHRSAYIGVSRPEVAFATQHICSNIEEYAHEMFEFFRDCDRSGIETIYCESVGEAGIGAAIMDRLRRAAED